MYSPLYIDRMPASTRVHHTSCEYSDVLGRCVRACVWVCVAQKSVNKNDSNETGCVHRDRDTQPHSRINHRKCSHHDRMALWRRHPSQNLILSVLHSAQYTRQHQQLHSFVRTYVRCCIRRVGYTIERTVKRVIAKSIWHLYVDWFGVAWSSLLPRHFSVRRMEKEKNSFLLMLALCRCRLSLALSPSPSSSSSASPLRIRLLFFSLIRLFPSCICNKEEKRKKKNIASRRRLRGARLLFCNVISFFLRFCSLARLHEFGTELLMELKIFLWFFLRFSVS